MVLRLEDNGFARARRTNCDEIEPIEQSWVGVRRSGCLDVAGRVGSADATDASAGADAAARADAAASADAATGTDATDASDAVDAFAGPGARAAATAAAGPSGPVDSEQIPECWVHRSVVRARGPDEADLDQLQRGVLQPDERERGHVDRESAGEQSDSGSGMAVCDGNAEPEWSTDSVVEWDVLGAVSDGWWRREFEFEWQLVSEWEPVAAVLDSAA